MVKAFNKTLYVDTALYGSLITNSILWYAADKVMQPQIHYEHRCRHHV